MQTLDSNMSWRLLTTVFCLRSQHFSAFRQCQCVQTLLCHYWTLAFGCLKWCTFLNGSAERKFYEFMLASCFIPKPLKQPSFNFFCFCSQTLFVLRPLMAWKPHSGKLFSDIVMCLLEKSQEIIVEADCSDRGKQIICISSFGKRDLEKRDGEGNDWPFQTYCHSTITVGN